VGRAADVIKTSGHVVGLFEVECHALRKVRDELGLNAD
jgi:acyl-coenzyme A synthetase/AMP-(fatty) acid ligase